METAQVLGLLLRLQYDCQLLLPLSRRGGHHQHANIERCARYISNSGFFSVFLIHSERKRNTTERYRSAGREPKCPTLYKFLVLVRASLSAKVLAPTTTRDTTITDSAVRPPTPETAQVLGLLLRLQYDCQLLLPSQQERRSPSASQH